MLIFSAICTISFKTCKCDLYISSYDTDSFTITSLTVPCGAFNIVVAASDGSDVSENESNTPFWI